MREIIPSKVNINSDPLGKWGISLIWLFSYFILKAGQLKEEDIKYVLDLIPKLIKKKLLLIVYTGECQMFILY